MLFTPKQSIKNFNFSKNEYEKCEYFLILDVETNDFKFHENKKVPIFQNENREYIESLNSYPELASISWRVEKFENDTFSTCEMQDYIFLRTNHDPNQTTLISKLTNCEFESGVCSLEIFAKLYATIQKYPNCQICGWNVVFDVNSILVFLFKNHPNDDFFVSLVDFFERSTIFCVQAFFCFIFKLIYWPRLVQAYNLLFNDQLTNFHSCVVDVNVTFLILQSCLKIYKKCDFEPFNISKIL